jgi:Spy/CpxP family protein refolding chaperone
MKSFAIILALVVGSAVAFAQAPGQTPPVGSNQVPNGRVPARPQQKQIDKREKIKQRIRALRAYTLTDQLNANDDTLGKLFPLLAHYDDEFDKLLQERAALHKQLDSAGDLKDPRAIDKLIDAAIANLRRFRDMEDQRLADVRKILTPAQTARLLIVLPEFERRIQNQLQRAINNPGKGMRHPPNLDDDDIEPDEKPARRPRAAPRRGPLQGPCDPFDAVHGCK